MVVFLDTSALAKRYKENNIAMKGSASRVILKYIEELIQEGKI